MHSIFSILACVIVTSAPGPQHLSSRIVSALDAETADCPVETRAYAESREVTCLKGTIGASQLKEVVDEKVARFREETGGVPIRRGEWSKSDVAVRGFFDFPETMLAVEYFMSITAPSAKLTIASNTTPTAMPALYGRT